MKGAARQVKAIMLIQPRYASLFLSRKLQFCQFGMCLAYSLSGLGRLPPHRRPPAAPPLP